MPDWVLTLLLAIVAPGGIAGGFLLYRRESKKAPIERSDIQFTQAIAISTAANALLQTMNERTATQNAKIAAQDAKIEKLEIKKEHYARRLHSWHAWYANVVNEWHIVRLNTPPPAPPELEEMLV